MKAFDNSTALLDAAKGLFKLYMDITENEYKTHERHDNNVTCCDVGKKTY